MKRLSLILLACGTAQGQLTAIDHSAVFDPVARTVTFTIEFSAAPDLYTLDTHGRVADTFQMHLHTLRAPGIDDRGNTIVRGGEIPHWGAIAFRDNMRPGQGEQGSEGWGPVLGLVPFTLDGARLTFTAPFAVVNTQAGRLDYELGVYHYGAETDWKHGATVYHLPAPGAVALLGLAGLRRRR